MFSVREWKRNLALRFAIVPEKRTDALRLKSLIKDMAPQIGSSHLVRIGSAGDGGYLAPDDFIGVAACLSPGVSTECGFDLEMARRGIDVFMADASVAGPPVEHERFRFTPHFIDAYENPQNITFESFVAPAKAAHPDSDWILQMDIEGAEWRVLLSAPPDTLSRSRIMIIEFHDLHRLFIASNFDSMAAVFRKLLSTHAVAHIHPNNSGKVYAFDDIVIPSIMEFTFYRRDRIVSQKPLADRFTYPHPLDEDCAPGRRRVVLPQIWRPSDGD